MRLRFGLAFTRSIFSFFLLLILFASSCATRHSQFGQRKPATIKDNFDNNKDVSHTFYLIGDAGDSDEPKSKKLFSILAERLKKADTSSTLLFLGDNVYPNGMPPVEDPERDVAVKKLQNQLALSKNFKGHTIFIPGNHDWYSGMDGLKDQEAIVTSYLKNPRSFLPQNSCGLDHVDINSNLALITIDSEWFLEDWDKHPTINEGCEMKSREQFFEQLELEINRNQNKTTIIAMHHPLLSKGSHGGEYSVMQQIFPLPVNVPLPIVGSAINLFRKTSGIINQDLQNKNYNDFIKRVSTLIRGKTNIVVVSGHDHTLQYIDQDGIKQIVSGSGSKEDAARAINPNDFSIGKNGYAVLQVLKSGASKVSYYAVDSKGAEALVFKQQPLFARKVPNVREFPTKFPATKDTSVYTTSMTQRGTAYQLLWGRHFRKYYSIPIRVKQVSLDTLYGGLKPTITGAEQLSRSLRLVDKNGKEYVLRALKKSATRFLQSVAFKDQSVEQDFQKTYSEKIVMDFYTTSHPYTPLVVARLAQKTGVSHTNPALYYVPKQNTLGLFNEVYGDELYMVEEVPSTEFKNLYSFGKPSKILETSEVLLNLQSDSKYAVDEDEYIKARIFDMLIGDWDRNADQWRWGEYKENGKIIYRPIPIDRDQAFTRYDGALFKVLMNFPELRHMKTFGKNLSKINWFNSQAYNLDQALIRHATVDDWIKQAAVIDKNLTATEIDQAFLLLPKEVRDKTVDDIRNQLKLRKKNLKNYAAAYYKVLRKTVLITGTGNTERFEITRADLKTTVKVYQVENATEKLVSTDSYKSGETKELWIYGLGADDKYEVKGYGRKPIRLRLLGGPDVDSYAIGNGKKTIIYDFKSTENTIADDGGAKLKLTDSYQLNTYDYERAKFNIFGSMPLLGYNPDDGVKLTGTANYTVNGFERNPFSQKHSVNGSYYFATNGFELGYRGVFPRIVGKWNLNIDALYTSPNFSINFFGLGNETPNRDNQEDLDYNRVKISTIRIAPSLQWFGEQGSSAVVQASFESRKVDPTAGRYISEAGIVDDRVFENQNFADFNARYAFANYDNPSNPTLGMSFSLIGGFKVNIGDIERRFPYAESALQFTYRLSNDGQWVLATLLRGKALFGDKYEFYQAATTGGDSDLRGFRNERFAGKQSFFQSSDIRYNLGKLQNGIIPVRYGIFAGFDYGRVWLPDEVSDRWHQSAGGGLWLNGVNLITARLSYFYSSDGGRIFFGVGFAF